MLGEAAVCTDVLEVLPEADAPVARPRRLRVLIGIGRAGGREAPGTPSRPSPIGAASRACELRGDRAVEPAVSSSEELSTL